MSEDTKASSEYAPGSAAATYQARISDREPYIRRAEEASQFTIPSLQPKVGSNGSTILHSPFQSVGSRGIKNLAAKLLLTLLPANAPFYRESLDEFTKEELAAGDPDKRAKIEEALNKCERTVQTHIEETTTRVTVSEGLLHFLLGNVLLYIPDDGNTRLFTLGNYVVIRSPAGQVQNIITREEIDRTLLSDHQIEILKQKETETPSSDESAQKPKKVVIHTQCKRTKTNWQVTQELNGIEDTEARGTYPLDACAYLPQRFRKIDGEDYGRGFIEEIIGDLRSLEGLSQSMLEAAAGVAKMLILVNPNGVTSKKTISNSPNLAVRDGKADDVTFLRSDKSPDLNWARQEAELIERRLELVFLLNSAVQRDAERVTAEEIRYVAQELEDGLGAVYSILTQEFQLPLVNRFRTILQRAGKLPLLPPTVKPKIITGLEALGRGHDLNRLRDWIAGVKELLNPDQVPLYVDITSVLKQEAIALGLGSDLVRSPQQVQETQQAQQQQELMNKAAPNVVKGVADHLNQAQAAVAAQPATQ